MSKNSDYINLEIQNVRHQLQELIKSKEGNLLDSKVLDLSEYLDSLVVKYANDKE
ncbi:aspartyl-phosphate phosphatase Spo0E family protein [Alkaliphilus metalliredigens]|uniref:aspartyl-phosphate phosphatase Spo0E family protein n=1 Tax=Alkaliphilus metalliredigens TaxID=208226 RepID=UPI00030E0589|nr:aspartyl-phosphate phosphatase Spo0E family protein [Alkaliphilus metalliredigens]